MSPRHPHAAASPPLGWADVAPAPLDRRTAWDWSLALTARDVPNQVFRQGPLWRVCVPAARLGEAAAEVAALAGENCPAPQPSPLAGPRGDTWTTALTLGLLVLFYVLTRTPLPGLGLYPPDWDVVGAADSTAILAGELWRAVTALTLHADPAHLAGNVLIGGVFLVLTARELGTGTALALALAAGAAGNLANAALYGPGHLSVGASTAVFGTVGVLAALRSVLERRLDLRRTLAPVAAGLGLLSMLGAGGERTDLGAHALGFAMGLALGAAVGLSALRRGLPGPRLNVLAGCLAAAAMVGAWLWGFAAS